MASEYKNEVYTKQLSSQKYKNCLEEIIGILKVPFKIPIHQISINKKILQINDLQDLIFCGGEGTPIEHLTTLFHFLQTLKN